MKHKKFIIYGICITALVIGFLFGALKAVADSEFFTGMFRSEKVVYCEVKDFNPTCTPGNVDVVDETKICTEPATRYVPDKLRKQIFKDYGIVYPPAYGDYELDHRIAKWAGGSDYYNNLWPQPSPDFRLKDRLEYLLYQRYCKKIITLEQARNEMIDWRASYKKYFEDKVLGSFNYEMMGYYQNPTGNP